MSSSGIALQLVVMTKTEKSAYHPLVASLLGILFVSTASIFIRFAQSEASSIAIAAIRLTLASLVLLPIALIKFRYEWQGLTKKALLKGILSGIFLALHFASWIKSLEFTSVASSVVIVTTTPLWVALLSPVILNEHIRKPVIIGLVIAIAGGILVGLGNICDFTGGEFVCKPMLIGGKAMVGNFLALFGAWMAAGYLMMGRQLRSKLNTVSYTALVYSIAALLLLLGVVINREPIFSYSAETYLWLFALGLIPQLLGHTIFNWSLKYISAAYVSLSLLGEPIGTILLAMIFLKESPTLLESIGAFIILAGIVVSSIRKSGPVNVA